MRERSIANPTRSLDVKRLLAITVLVFAGWLTLSVAWAAGARLTGLPGPAAMADASIGAAAEGLEAVHLSPPLSAPRRAVTRGMRAGARALTRLYAVPERIAARLVGGGERPAVGIEPFVSWTLGPEVRIDAEVVPERERRVRVHVRVPEAPAVGSGERMDRVREHLERVRERLERVETRIEARVIEVRPGG